MSELGKATAEIAKLKATIVKKEREIDKWLSCLSKLHGERDALAAKNEALQQALVKGLNR